MRQLAQPTNEIKVSKNYINKLVDYGGYIAFFLVIAFFSIASSSFLTFNNIVNILNQSSTLGVVGLGLTIIFISGGNTDVIRGGIDLSLANNLAVSVAIMAILLSGGSSLFLAFGVALVTGILIGVINAIAIVKFNVIPLLATLAMMFSLRGLEGTLTKNVVIPVDHPVLQYIGTGTFIGLPIPLLIFAAMSSIYYLVFNKSIYGNWANAVGGNHDAAKTSGININKVLYLSYILAGFTAVIGGLISISRLSGSVNAIGDLMLLDMLLVGFMSTIFNRLAIPNIPGVILSAFFVGTLSNGFVLMNVPTYWVYGIKGILILVAVAITQLKKEGSAV